MSALDTQVGGSHYANKTIQPVELAYARGYDGFVFSVLKYVTRHREKGGAQDLRKARHFVDLRREVRARLPKAAENHWAALANRLARDSEVTAQEYAEKNDMVARDAEIVVALDKWHLGKVSGETLNTLIDDLLFDTYGEFDA